MFKRLFKYQPTGQEQQLIEIVNQLLEHPKTSLRMTPVTNKYFLINEQKHYYILLKENGIQITNSKFSIVKVIHPKAFNIIIDDIHEHIEASRQQLEDKLFMRETQILDGVLEKLKL